MPINAGDSGGDQHIISGSLHLSNGLYTAADFKEVVSSGATGSFLRLHASGALINTTTTLMHATLMGGGPGASTTAFATGAYASTYIIMAGANSGDHLTVGIPDPSDVGEQRTIIGMTYNNGASPKIYYTGQDPTNPYSGSVHSLTMGSQIGYPLSIQLHGITLFGQSNEPTDLVWVPLSGAIL
tara:strand:+ start:272 stop:823 length:552 start_codon:yes stop_codon:yes gene_type:complete